ncbi:MAG: hypothetical protein QM736_06590 [Vicinamibacterales bacterium]
MQRLRGSVYLNEGNITSEQLTVDGRHRTPEDELGWHLLMTDNGGRITSCVLYLEHGPAVTMDDLRVKHCPLIHDEHWQAPLYGAVRSEIQRARRAGLGYAEIGGLAVDESRRCSIDSLMLALATYALGRARGGALGITTANVAHSCSSILRRLGGSSLQHHGVEIPAYYDPRYHTEIELLRFDSRDPSRKYASVIDQVERRLSHVQIMSGANGAALDVHRAPVKVSETLQPVAAA